MKVEVISARELSPELLTRWDEIRQADPSLRHPCFDSAFTLCAARVWHDVRVGVIEDAAEVVGFFPFQRKRLGVGVPVADRLSDYQGIIIERRVELNARELVRRCGLSCYEFDHFLARQTSFASHAFVADSSPIMDLSEGYAAYRSARLESGSRRLGKLERSQRKLWRDFPGAEFDLSAAPGDRALAWVIEQKRAQCRRTGVVDFFADKHYRDLLHVIHESDAGDFAGVLTTLSSGDDLIAAHFGMRSSEVLHWWFPAYDHEYAPYSPGVVLLVMVAQACPDSGIRTIDLGKGDDAYKDSFVSDRIPLLEGRVVVPSIGAGVHAAYRGARFLTSKSRGLARLVFRLGRAAHG